MRQAATWHTFYYEYLCMSVFFVFSAAVVGAIGGCQLAAGS
jgi:hypothetical protein